MNYKLRIGKSLIRAAIVTFAVVLLFWILRGYSTGQMLGIIGILFPIKSVYFTSFVKYLYSRKDETENEAKEDPMQLTKFKFSRTILWFEAILIITIMLINQFQPDLITYDQLIKSFLPVIESAFGVYLGIIINDYYFKSS